MRSIQLSARGAQVVSLMVCFAILLPCLDRGYGIGDESFYFAWALDPGRYQATIHTFGWPLHLAFVAVGRSFVALRAAGIALLLASGALLGWQTGRYYEALGMLRGANARLATLGMLFSLSYYVFFILTPGYNLLANAGGASILAGALGWAIADRRVDGRSDGRSDVFCSILVGIGGCLAFFGKPTLAASAGLLVAGTLFMTGRRGNWRQAIIRALIVAAACLVPLLATLQATGTIAGSLATIRTGLAVLDFDNSLTKLPAKTIADLLKAPRTFDLTIALFAVTAVLARRAKARVQALEWINLAWMLVTILNLVRTSISRIMDESPWAVVGIYTVSVVITLFSYGIARSERQLPARAAVPLALMMVMPFLTALGTALPLTDQIGLTLYPVLLAAVVGTRLLLPGLAALAVQIGAVLFVPAILYWAAIDSYQRPRPMTQQNVEVRSPFSRDTFRVDPVTANYLNTLHALAVKNGLKPGGSVIDMTSAGPGTVLALGGVQHFFPWLNGDFVASGNRVADAIWMAMTPQQRRAAWVIGPLDPHLSASGAAKQILRAHARYRLAGTVPFIRGNKSPILLHIWVPVR